MEIREKILEAANKLFMLYGIRSITMDDIAKDLSISKKTIYQYFKDKDEVVLLSIRQYMDQQNAAFIAMHQKASNTLEELYLISQHMKDNFQKVSMSTLMDIQKFYPEAWALFLDYKESIFKQSIRETIIRGIKEGVFRDDLDADLMAILRFEQIQMCFNPGVIPKERESFGDVQEQLFIHFVQGLLTEKGRELSKTYFK